MPRLPPSNRGIPVSTAFSAASLPVAEASATAHPSRTTQVIVVPSLPASNRGTPVSSASGDPSGFDGLNELQSCGGRCTPPDVQVAAGPNHVMEMVNLRRAVYLKTGSPILNQSLSNFFNAGTDFVSDPKVLYDSFTGRWFASILDVDNLSNISRSNVLVSVSSTNDPTGNWTTYNNVSFGPDMLPDQPILGLNDYTVVVSVNLFKCNHLANCSPSGSTSPTYQGAVWWVLNKNDLVNHTTPRAATFGPDASLGSVHPVQSLSSTSTEYMVSTGAVVTNSSPNSTSTLVLFSVNGVPGTSNVTTTQTTLTLNRTISQPPDGLERCNPCNDLYDFINTDDYRVQDAELFQGRIWLGLNDGCKPDNVTLQACIRLIQVDTLLSHVRQDFDSGRTGYDYYYPALRVDSAGNLAVIYGFSAPASPYNLVGVYPSLAVTGQGYNDPLNSLTPAQTIKDGSASEETTRYGDYFGAGVDPSDPTIIWFAGEYHNSATGNCTTRGNCWSTFIQGVPISDFTIAANPTSLTFNSGSTGTSTITLTSQGTFAGTVTLTTSVSPTTGLTANCVPSSVSLTAGGSGTSTCTFSSSTPGGYTVTVTGTSGSLTHSVQISVTVTMPDFSTSANPGTLTFRRGSTGTSTITLTSLNSFTGSVTLTATVSPIVTRGPTATLNPTSVTLSSGGSGNSTLTITTTRNTPTGTYTVTVTGTSGSKTHSVTVTVNVTK